MPKRAPTAPECLPQALRMGYAVLVVDLDLVFLKACGDAPEMRVRCA